MPESRTVSRLLTRKDAAEQLNVSPRWLSDRVRDFQIPILRAGHRMLLDAKAMALITESMGEQHPRLNLSPRVAARASLFWRRGSVEEALELACAGKRKIRSTRR
jgi:hypothetical protein